MNSIYKKGRSVESDGSIRDLLQEYGFEASKELTEKIQIYISLLLRWNQKIALTTIIEPSQIVRFHFGESILALVALPDIQGRLADVGTGAGFPGLALKLARPELDVTLIEANLKKCTFLSEVCRALELKDVKILHKRMEEVIDSGCRRVDLLTARAVGQTKEILRLGRSGLDARGRVLLWLGIEDAQDASRRYTDWHWSPPIPIAGSERRSILCGTPVEDCST